MNTITGEVQVERFKFMFSLHFKIMDDIDAMVRDKTTTFA
jgi:hypothetical protein